LFTLHNTGIVTGIDSLSIFLTKKELKNTVENILSIENPFYEYNRTYAPENCASF
jgi:hypothetical protein